MRVLRDKLWAKLTALVLFVLLGFLALLRTAQLFSNYMPGDEVGGRVLFIAVCAAGCLVCLVFSLSSAGHWAEHEGIYLTWLDRIPLDVLFLVPLCMWMEASWATVGLYWLSSIVYWAALLCVTALFAVSFAPAVRPVTCGATRSSGAPCASRAAPRALSGAVCGSWYAAFPSCGGRRSCWARC